MQQNPPAYTSHGRHGADASFERGNPGPLANLPFPVFPERCDAPPEVPRDTADMSCTASSFERGNAGPEAVSQSSQFPERCKSGLPEAKRRQKKEVEADIPEEVYGCKTGDGDAQVMDVRACSLKGGTG